VSTAAVSFAVPVASGAAAHSRSAKATAAPLQIAYFASADANGFSEAVWQGAQAEAKVLGNVQLTELDGNFSATTQFDQLQTAATSKQYSGAIALLNDTVGSVPAVQQLIASGTAVSALLNPEGSNLDSLSPQVPGLLETIAAPSYDTALQAQQVVKYCTGKKDCTVVIFIGGLVYPFDKVRYDSFLSVLKPHKNIHVLALGQGNYDVDTSLSVMQNILKAHPKFDVLLSASDQSTVGVEIALKDAGWNVPKMIKNGSFFVDSLGGSEQGVAEVRDGFSNLTVQNSPYTAGELGLAQVVNDIRGNNVQTIINLDKASPVPLILTKSVLAKHPKYKGQWNV